MQSKKRSISIFAILLGFACWLSLPPLSLAQSAGTGALTGTVTDPSGAVTPGATVTITSADTNLSRTTTTGADGSYKFSLLPPGVYRVRFSATGFRTAEAAAVTVNVTETRFTTRDSRWERRAIRSPWKARPRRCKPPTPRSGLRWARAL